MRLLLVFILFLSFRVNSQSYVSMLKYQAEWHVTNCYFACATDKYYTNGDTIINGLYYKFLDLFHYQKNFLIREDTITRKVYLRLLADPPPVKDYLLYDFSLQVNDSISITNPGSPYPKYPGTFMLDSIVLRPLLTKPHRYFYFHALDTLTAQTRNTIWVEGIGSLSLINTPGAMPQIEGIGQLSCFFSNNINEYSQLDSIADCTPIYPLGLKEKTITSFYNISQDFENNTLKISSNKKQFFRCSIYNLEGKLLFYSSQPEVETIISLKQFSKGLLLLKIEDDDGTLYSSKILNY